MYYLIKQKINSNIQSLEISHTSIYTTKEEKLKFIRAIHEDKYHFLNLLNLIYPNTEENYICSAIFQGAYSIYNEKLIGLSIQIAIAIIENPYIICVGSDVNIPSDAIRLYKNISRVESVYKIQYNGNYCILIGSKHKTYFFERILISTTDSELLPAFPEWVFNVSGWNSLLYDPKKPSWRYANQIFVNDFDIEAFLNANTEYETIYVIANDGKYFKWFKFFKKFNNVIFIINVNNINKKYYQYLKRLPGFKVIINSGKNIIDQNLLLDHISYESSNILIEENLLKENHLSSFTYKEYGMICNNDDSYQMENLVSTYARITPAFKELRNKLGLNVINNSNETYITDFSFKPFIT